MDKTLGQYLSISKENVAAILALVGKEESTTKSPTALVMLGNLKHNFSYLFDRMVSKEHDFATIRLGTEVGLDDRYFMFCRIEKTNKVTEMQALASCMNSIIQENQSYHLKCVGRTECTDCYEFVISIMRGPYE